MKETFAEMLVVGGKTNSLGRAAEVLSLVLEDQSRLEELYLCIFAEDAWVRMRAVDSFEKVCRMHPEWIAPYIDRFANELSVSTQPSVQWHLAEMYGELPLTDTQKRFAIDWLTALLSSPNIDWIVPANTMATLAHFTRDGSLPVSKLVFLLKIQQQHKSNAVKKRASKLLDKFLI